MDASEMKTPKLSSVETEGMHYDQLIHALRKFKEAASRREWDIGWLQNAVQHCVAIGHYRDDARWLKVAAILDEAGKSVPGSGVLSSNLCEHLDFIIQNVVKLKNRRLN